MTAPQRMTVSGLPSDMASGGDWQTILCERSGGRPC